MKLSIIQNQQTPKIENYKSIERLLSEDYRLLERFLGLCMSKKNCIGLASNQVACNGQRIMEPFFTERDRNGWAIYIHPKIIEFEGKKYQTKEGCLTWQGKVILAERYPGIVMEYYNLKGVKKIERASGLDIVKAQVWQHEYNHLMGIEEKFIGKDV